MIEIKNLHKSFGRLKVLKDINLQLNAGQCIALIGPNGCGKTTLLKCVLGLTIPQAGEILVQGKSIIHQHIHRDMIGYMPQIGRYPGNLTIGQLIEMVRNLRPSQKSYDEELIETLGVAALTDKKMSGLSGGTIQKVSAVLAFLFDPPVLILDEPTAGLDPLAAEVLKKKIADSVSKGKLVLITSHILSELDELVTEIIFMQDGQLVFHRPIQDLLTETVESRISRAIVSILHKKSMNEQNT